MCFSSLKNIKSLTSKNSGTLIVIRMGDYFYIGINISRKFSQRNICIGKYLNFGIFLWEVYFTEKSSSS
jgi:hypothetical protein